MSPAARQVELEATDVDLQFLLESEDVHLGGMDGVEDEGEDQRQEEGHPTSQQKGENLNILSPHVHISSSHNGQDSQAAGNISDLTWQLINYYLHELETEDDEDVEALLYKLGVVLDLIFSQVDLVVTK